MREFINCIKSKFKKTKDKDTLLELLERYKSCDDGYWTTVTEFDILYYLQNKYKKKLKSEHEKYKDLIQTIEDEIQKNTNIIKLNLSEDSIKRAENRIDLCKKLLSFADSNEYKEVEYDE